jgi:hypothetical protein
VRLLEWGSVTCTALVTVRDVRERGVCPGSAGAPARKRESVIQTMTTHPKGMLRDPGGDQVRPLEWGSVTCTALVTERDVMGWESVYSAQDSVRGEYKMMYSDHDYPPGSVSRGPRGRPGASPGVGVSDMHCLSHST